MFRCFLERRVVLLPKQSMSAPPDFSLGIEQQEIRFVWSRICHEALQIFLAVEQSDEMGLFCGWSVSPNTACDHTSNESGDTFEHSNLIDDISLIVSEILLESFPPRPSCLATLFGEPNNQQSNLPMSVIGQDDLSTGKGLAH